MRINTEFNLGQTVWYLSDNNEIKKTKVEGVEINTKKHKHDKRKNIINTWYTLGNKYGQKLGTGIYPDEKTARKENRVILRIKAKEEEQRRRDHYNHCKEYIKKYEKEGT